MMEMGQKKMLLFSQENFDWFKSAISTTINSTHTVYKEELKSRLSRKFQIIDQAQILTE